MNVQLLVDKDTGLRKNYSIEKEAGVHTNTVDNIPKMLEWDIGEVRSLLNETSKKVDVEAGLLKEFVKNRELGQDRAKIKTLIKIVEHWIKNKIKRGEGLEHLEKHLSPYDPINEVKKKVIPELTRADELRQQLRAEKKNFTKDDYYLTIAEQFEKQYELYRKTFENPTKADVTYWKELNSIKEKMEGNAIRVGQKMKHFRIKNENGEWIDSRELLKTGPLVVSFFVGSFCPYCVNEMCVLADSISRIKAMGANLVSIGPDKTSIKYFRKLGVIGDILVDDDLKVSKTYNLVYPMTQNMIDYYLVCGCNVPAFNGGGGWQVPIPATYVVNQDGTVVYDFVQIEYYKRADPI